MSDRRQFNQIFERFSSARAQNDVDSRVGRDEITHLADLEGISRLLERSLHLTRTKEVEVTTILTRATLTEVRSTLGEGFRLSLQLWQQLAELSPGLLLRSRDLLAGLTNNRVARARVLEEDVAGADGWDEVKKLDLELEGGLRRNDWRMASGAVSVLGRTDQDCLAALAQLEEALVPALDDLADADLGLEGPLLLDGGVED